MNEIMPILEQFRTLLVQNAPVDAWTKTLPMLAVLLLAGIAVSVFGAKLAKFAVAAACGLVGASFGAAMARETGFAVPPCAVIAGAMLAVVGYMTFRLWVGVITAGVLALLAISIFGQGRLDTHLAEFRQSEVASAQSSPVLLAEATTASAPLAGTEFIPPALPSAGQSIQRFWSFLKSRDATLATQTKGVAVATALGGLFLGVVLVRVMLILSMSLVGTVLVVTAVIGILASLFPTMLNSLEANPSISAIGVGGLLVTSLIVQTLLTKGGESAVEPSGKAKV